MKFLTAAILLSLLGQGQHADAPTLASFRYLREILYPETAPDHPSPNACAILDADVFAHANSGLSDLRVFDSSGKLDIPYVVTLSSTPAGADPARLAHVAASGTHQLDVDLGMPPRSYSQVNLSVNARNFVASAHVTGLRTLSDPNPVFLGDFTLFDLAAQHLGSNTSLPIAESTFPYLRLRLQFQPAPGNAALLITPSTLAAAEVPPARQAQTLYTTVAENSAFAQHGQQTVVTFSIPAHVPVERVTFELDPAEHSNFSRMVTVSASAGASAPVELLTGQISRVHLAIGGRKIQQESLSFPAILGSTALSPASVEVAVENGEQPPLNLRSVRLEMRQRQLCFPAAGTSATLAYGSPSVQATSYDFARTFTASAQFRRATVAQERKNALFVASSREPSRFSRYSAFLGLSLVVALSLLAVIAYRALHRGHHDSIHR
jgi:hypothetical protein